MVTPHESNPAQSPRHVVLIMSSDAVAAALVGALVETLGYGVRFYQSPEDPTTTLRRERPDVAMLDGADRLMISDAVLGHAAMRGIAVVIFGSAEALEGIREIARTHKLHTLIAPPTLHDTSELLANLVGSRG